MIFKVHFCNEDNRLGVEAEIQEYICKILRSALSQDCVKISGLTVRENIIPPTPPSISNE